MRVTGRMPPPLTWHNSQIIIECLSPIVYACVFNQSRGHWLLNDALHYAIFHEFETEGRKQNISSFESLMENDSIIFNELSLMASNMKRKVINVLDSFFSFLKKYENRKTHNMISFTLDLKSKNLHIVSSFVGREQGVAVVEEYDKKNVISYVDEMP